MDFAEMFKGLLGNSNYGNGGGMSFGNNSGYSNQDLSNKNKEKSDNGGGGGEYDFTDKLTEIYPIYWGTVSDLMKDDVNALNGILAFYAFFGGGVNVYDDKEKDKSKEKKTAPRLIQR